MVLKLGIIIIFFGVSFLLKYAAQCNMFPIEFRLMGVFAAGLLLLLIGWRLRNRTDHRYSYPPAAAATLCFFPIMPY